MAALPAAMARGRSQSSKPAVWDHFRRLRFVLSEPLEHPFFWWPRTLLSYLIVFEQPVDLKRLTLTRSDNGEQTPIQFSDVVESRGSVRSATLNFFSDLPSGGHREFLLSVAAAPADSRPQVTETSEDSTIVLDSGAMRIRIPATQDVSGDAPGPVLQVSRGGAWVGASKFAMEGDRVTRITSTRVEQGPLFVSYRIAYETAGGSHYIATVRVIGGADFVSLKEDMEGVKPGVHGAWTSSWTGFDPTHRQAPNHPIPVLNRTHPYDEYPWETVDEPFPLGTAKLPDGLLPFQLGIYQSWTAFRDVTSSNFWNQQSGDALGIFIDRSEEWIDHQYANHVEAEALQVRYYHEPGRFTWQWPVRRGSRSVCLSFYDHAKDEQAMHELERCSKGVEQDGLKFTVGLAFTSHMIHLQNRYGTLDLNCVKDWVLTYPDNAKRAPVIFQQGSLKDAADVETRVLTSQFVCSLPVFGTRENGATGNIPGRGIVNFSPVPSRQILGWWIDGFNRCQAQMTERQRRRVSAMFVLTAYVCAGDDFMPFTPMLTGHPNFLADVKGALPGMSFLFPEHPMASIWADHWQKAVEINTRYNTRPAVKAWDARAGRWTENLGTYVWAFLRPSVRADFLLRKFDAQERFLSPQLAQMADWLVNALSAPFAGESPEAYKRLQTVDYGHEWGTVKPGSGLHRVHPPQGAHSDQRIPPRSLWYLGTCLARYAPLAAEHAMWASRPTNQDMEVNDPSRDPWNVMYAGPDNRGTNPHLRSTKYTGYGITLRAAVDTPNEVSLHLQQIDEGPNYRWGQSGEGGNGVIYFYAAGKAYSFNGSEDVGDRFDQDTDFCTNFAVYKNGFFHSIGMNVLSRPFYDLGAGQFAEIVPRQGPTQYAAPEYVGRSVLLAGHDYFVLYDQVLNKTVDHRLSWFVRRGNELPAIQLLRGYAEGKETQRTDLETEATTGVWFDGTGDSMALVSHRKDIQAKDTAFGCRVKADDIDDLVFRGPEPVRFSEGGIVFEGTAGLVRRRKNSVEFALFHGTKIGVEGVVLSTADTELGISGTALSGQPLRGTFYAPQVSSVTITSSPATEKASFFVDGAPVQAQRNGNSLTVALPQGLHAWELTGGLPVPVAPRILRTENIAGGAKIVLEPVASAAQYRIEISKDDAATWNTAGMYRASEAKVTGLANGSKAHVRAVAVNAEHESAPGNEYPLYVTDKPPAPPDGLHVDLAEGSATLTWGEVLGVSEYRLYARSSGEREFRLLASGLHCMHVDKRAVIHPSVRNPWKALGATAHNLIEYCVTAVNGNGESARSRIADTNPASWRNWDPVPGEPFRRPWSFDPDQPASTGELPRYYPE